MDLMGTYGLQNVLVKKVLRIDPSNGTKTTMLDLSGLVDQSAGQDGLLGMAIHPELYNDINTTTNNYVYLAYTYNSSGLKVRIARYAYDSGTGTLNSGTATTILEGFDASFGHNGGKLIIGPPNVPIANRKLFYSVGDQEKNRGSNACNEIRAQYLPTSPSDHSDYQGKILRMELDGSIPSDNPTLNGIQSHVYSYGHRNPQGIIFGSDGTLYSSEHGDKTDDELNIIEAGKNYGWPLIAGYNDDLGYAYCNWSAYPGQCGSYDQNSCPGSSVDESTSYASISANFKEPIGTYNSTVTVEPTGSWLTWPTVAPASINIYEAGLIPDWNKSLLIPTLKGNTIFRAKLNVAGDGLDSQTYEEFHSESNTRFRDITMDPDGITMYTVTDAGTIEKLQFVGTTLSTDEIANNTDFNIFPNPAKDTFKVNFAQGNNSDVNISIIDMQGKLVKTITNAYQNENINIAELSNGIYFLKTTKDNFNGARTKKLIVKK
jgi:PQQ-dependent dehydrogenase (s-GDH family)